LHSALSSTGKYAQKPSIISRFKYSLWPASYYCERQCYTQNEQHIVARFNPQTKQVENLLRLPLQVQDFILKDDSTLAYALNNRVYQRNLSGNNTVSQWLDLTPYCHTNITRMSYNNDKLAFVCDVAED